jgi:exonuclease III
MNKQTKSLTESKKASNLALLSSTERLALRETLTQTEAKEWIQRYRKKTMEYGKSEAYSWWQTTLADIAKRRGKQAAEDLRNRMNKIKSGETK